MSNIDVNERSPVVWLWIIGLVVVAVLVWALIEMFSAARHPVPVTAADTVIDTVRTVPLPSLPSMAPVGTSDTAAASAATVDSLPPTANDTANGPAVR